FAAISGILYAASIHFAVSGDVHFQSFYSLTLLALLALAPFAEPWYAIFALIAAVIPGYLTSADVSSWLNALFGVSAIFVALRGGHAGMPARLRRILEGFGRPRRAKPAAAPVPQQRAPEGQGLDVRNLRVAFGGLVAVDDLSFSVPLGRITGLIGPNGAGKTTTFNACSGLNRPSTGRVTFNGADIGSLSPAARARLGIGRTFQQAELWDSLSVLENVALGREAPAAGQSVFSQLMARPKEPARMRATARDAMAVA